MEDISELLQEAKPLYLKRKRNRRIVKIFSAVSACFIAVVLIGSSLSRTPEQICDLWSNEVYQAQNGSVIEDMGLPVDDFGLLWVG